MMSDENFLLKIFHSLSEEEQMKINCQFAEAFKETTEMYGRSCLGEPVKSRKICRYAEICPAYDAVAERCVGEKYRDFKKCVPLLLEAYHQEKGTDYDFLRKFL